MSQQLRKWFKIATNSIIRGSNFFVNIKIRSKCFKKLMNEIIWIKSRR